MSATAITLTKLELNTPVAMPAGAAFDGTDGALIDFSGDDGKILIILTNTDSSNAETVTIKAGDSFWAKADLSISLAASQTKIVTLESGPYLITTGANKKKLSATASADVKIAAVKLP